MPRSKHSPYFAHGTTAVTGSSKGIKPGLNRIEEVVPVVKASLAADANKADSLTIVIATDRKSFDIYAWKATSSSDPTLIAATAAVNVGWIAVGE